MSGNTCKTYQMQFYPLSSCRRDCLLGVQANTGHEQGEGSWLTSVAVFREIDSISRYLKYSSMSMYTIDTIICRVVTAGSDVAWSDSPNLEELQPDLKGALG